MRHELRPFVRLGLALVALGGLFAVSGAAAGYPMTLAARAKATSGETTISSTVTIVVDRLMEASRRTRVLDGLKYDGYKGFMNALRPLPPIGRVSTQNASVDLRYAWETKAEDHRRL